MLPKLFQKPRTSISALVVPSSSAAMQRGGRSWRETLRLERRLGCTLEGRVVAPNFCMDRSDRSDPDRSVDRSDRLDNGSECGISVDVDSFPLNFGCIPSKVVNCVNYVYVFEPGL